MNDLTDIETRLVLRAVSNSIDRYAIAISRTPRNCETRLSQLENDRRALMIAYKKLKEK